MEYLKLLTDSFFNFFMIPIFTIVPCLVYSKYRFPKKTHLFFLPICVLGFSLIDVSQNIMINLVNKSSTSYTMSFSSFGNLFVVFLIILLLRYKKVPVYQAIINMCSIYLVADFVNLLYFSNIIIDITTPSGYGGSLLVITFSSVFLCIILFKLLDYLAVKINTNLYRFSVSLCISLFILGKNLIFLFFSSTSNMNSSMHIVFEQIDNKILDESLVTTGKAMNTDIFLFAIVIVLVFLLTVLSSIYYKEQRLRFQAERTKELESYIETIEMIRDEVLSYQHDYDNIFAGISGYIYEDEIDQEKLRDYYEQSAERIFHNDGLKVIKLLHLKNIEIPEIKGILSQKILQARQKNIYVQLEVAEPVTKLPMDKIDLTRCLGILLDNAIDAASLSEAKQLTIAFIFIEKQLLIVIKNSINTGQAIAANSLYKKRFTSKKEKDKHGFGLFNIHRIMEKYENINLKTTILAQDYIQEIIMNLEERDK